MKFLILIGGLVVVGLCIGGVLFILENVNIKKGKRK